jgi:hypothetical protein
MSNEIPEANPSPNAEEQSASAKLTEADLRVIDAAILANCSHRWLKVALVVTSTEDALKEHYPALSYVYYSTRVVCLASKGRLEFQGDLQHIRFCEVRIAP